MILDMEAGIRAALAEGNCFRAHDLCLNALKAHTDNLHFRLLSALTSLRGGDVSNAKAIVGPLVDEFESTESRVQRLTALLGATDPINADSAREVAGLLGRLSTPVLNVDAGALDLMANICLEAWRRLHDAKDLSRATGLAARAFALEPSPERAYAAAVLAELSGRRQDALTYCRHAVAAPRTGAAGASFAHYSRSGLLALLQAEPVAALVAFRAAGEISRHQFALRVSLRRELAELAASGLAVPAQALEYLPAPSVVLFSGPRVDFPGTERPIFPPHIEHLVADKIKEELESLAAEIGYSCADPGANLLFVEAMLERDAEVNIILPCAVDDFIESRVRPLGGHWEKRFRHALKLAHSVTLTTTDPLLNNSTALEHNSHVIDGTARLRARTLGCKPFLLTVWDFNLTATPGSTASFIDHWGDPARLRMVDLELCRTEAGLPETEIDFAEIDISETDASATSNGQRTVCSMLFADIVGYSKLQEADLPAFWRYMAALAQRMTGCGVAPFLIESWGDALYVVHQTSGDMANYALALTRAFNEMSSLEFGLPGVLNVRIGLHTGPVFLGQHPLTGRTIVYGGQVNRAARIEPIAKPGMIYASEQFVATLVAEESLHDHLRGNQERFAFEYLGTLDLAKNYGRQAIYLITAAAPV
jgi:class 3 adenylate cyclase